MKIVLLIELQTASRGKRLISATPLIDVVFILLLFFMLSSTFSPKSQIPINITPSITESSPLDSSVYLVLTPNNVVLFDENQYQLGSNAFDELVSSFKAGNKTVTVAGAQGINIQDLITLIDAMGSANVENIRIGKSIGS